MEDLSLSKDRHLGKKIEALQRRIAELEASHICLEKDLILSRTANKFLSSVLDTVDALVVIVDSNGQIIRINRSFQQTIGYVGGHLSGKYIWDLFLLPDDITSVRSIFGSLLSSQCRTATENYWLSKDSALRLISWSFTAVHNSLNQVDYVVGVGRDVTEQEQAEEELRMNKERYRQLFNSVNDAVFVYSLEKSGVKRLIEVNAIACERLGYSRDDILKFVPDDIEHPLSEAQVPLIAHKLQQHGHALYEAIHFSKSGRQIPVEVNAHLFLLHGERTVLSVARDITERKEMEEKLRFITMHDSLTGLYNRAYFDEEIRRLDLARDAKISIIVLDVDGLKIINDSMGHLAGDSLLRSAAKVIASALREGDFFARIGGDEFAIILYNITRAETERICARIRNAVSFHNSENPELPLSISLGFAASGNHGTEVRKLFKEADDHMYREKLHHSKSTRSTLVQGLMKALEARDFITEGHGDRLAFLIDRIGKTIGLAERDLAELRLLAQFHDFGKVGIPDRILFKPGKLTTEEYVEMQRHCEIGHRIAQSVPDLIPIADKILKHHEWWNGSGYPLGLKGDEIPLECRILSIADAYDAMTSDRPYRKAMTAKDALAELHRCKGTQFDPQLVEQFEDALLN